MSRGLGDVYKRQAKKYDLFITAGSDYHGTNKLGIEMGINISKEELEPFLNILRML